LEDLNALVTERRTQSDAEIRISGTLLQVWKIFHAPRLQVMPFEILVRIVWAIMLLPSNTCAAIFKEAKERVEKAEIKGPADF
jgi:hypothetical protein